MNINQSTKCRICFNTEKNSVVNLRGTLYGTKGKFRYFICKKCGCMQIVDLPDDIDKYYDNDVYYSFNMENRKLKNFLLFSQMKNQIQKRNLIGTLVQKLYPVNYKFFRYMNPEKDRILDVGCGQGEMLLWLKRLGFKKLQGIDPYLPCDKNLGEIKILKSEILQYQPTEKYDMITFIHSFEHIYDVHLVIEKVNSWVKEGGYLVFQLPFFSKFYWEKYGNALYTLDPPRHFYIHTKESLNTLVQAHGYEMISFETEIDPAIPVMAYNIKHNRTEKNQGTGFLTGALSSICSQFLRKELKANDDGAIATVVFKKIRE